MRSRMWLTYMRSRMLLIYMRSLTIPTTYQVESLKSKSSLQLSREIGNVIGSTCQYLLPAEDGATRAQLCKNEQSARPIRKIVHLI